jgi:hypothetical protein
MLCVSDICSSKFSATTESPLVACEVVSGQWQHTLYGVWCIAVKSDFITKMNDEENNALNDEAEEIEGERRGSKILHCDGYYYRLKSEKFRYVCKNKDKHRCPARAIYKDGVVTIKKGHNHPRNYLDIKVFRLKNAMKLRAETCRDNAITILIKTIFAHLHLH